MYALPDLVDALVVLMDALFSRDAKLFVQLAKDDDRPKILSADRQELLDPHLIKSGTRPGLSITLSVTLGLQMMPLCA